MKARRLMKLVNGSGHLITRIVSLVPNLFTGGEARLRLDGASAEFFYSSTGSPLAARRGVVMGRAV
jgi:hypothetical protein